MEEIKRRYAAGESARALAREFKCGAATISRHCSRKVERIKVAASKVVEADQALAALPAEERGLALRLADDMKATAGNLARAARAGSATAAQLAEMAHERAKGVRLAAPAQDGSLIDKAALADVGSLSFAANRAMSPALRLVIANRDAPPPPPDDEDEVDYASLTADELDQAERLALKARGELA
jgi:hypothetical protein